MNRLTLLGDSILDNAAYTNPSPDTTYHLQQRLAPEWTVRRLALDGAIMADIPGQLKRMESRPEVAILSVGGNDAMKHLDLLEREARTSAEILHELTRITDAFAEQYEQAARAVCARARRTVLCTIYEVPLEPPAHAYLARTPIALFNDRIIVIGARLGLDVLDLRSVCTDAGDFVMQIEPSARGAEKIADAIASVVSSEEDLRRASIFARP